jgi:hypothetical protein
MRLKSLDIQRELIKLALMTKPYNATGITIIQYLKDEFEFDAEYSKDMNKTKDLSSLQDGYNLNEDLNISGKNMKVF